MSREFNGAWKGQTVVCIASGPSLTPADCALVRDSGLTTIVTNNTWAMCPWAHVLMAFDSRWWFHHRKEVASFTGQKFTCSPSAPGAQSLFAKKWFKPFGNSGAAAVSLAVAAGAARVVMLGFDCSPAPDGRKHWHEDHPEPLSNARSIGAWPRKFEKLAAYAREHNCAIINASRRTALTCFERADLETLLHPGRA